MILAKTPLVIFDEHFSGCGGHEYRPWNLLIGMQASSNFTSSGVTGL